MKVLGIIAEFNPMHIGHKYLIEEAKRKTNATHVILVLSGNFTQAGNVSILPKYTKAQIATMYGVDLVIELPTIYATSSAKEFAYGAINILHSLNCVDYIAFGTECKSIDRLKNIADILVQNEEKISIETAKLQESNTTSTYSTNYSNILANYLTKEELEEISKPNNILAIEYLKFLKKLNSNIQVVTFERIANVSSTYIRNTLNNLSSVQDMLIPECYEYIEKNITKITNIYTNYYTILKYNILNRNITDLKEIYEISEGLENALLKNINISNTYEEFALNVKSKRYTLAKIKRMLVNLLINKSKVIHDELIQNNVIYAHILAKKQQANELISNISKKSNITLITKLNENVLNSLDINIQKSISLDILASNIYSVILDDNMLLNIDFRNKL